MYASLGQRLFIGAAVVLLTTINAHAPARAQTLSSDPIRIDDDPKPPPAPRNECTAKHKVSVYRGKGYAASESGAEPNHRSIEEAICHAGAGERPEVIIYRDPYDQFLPGFVVNKPNLTIRAADADEGGAVAVSQKRSGKSVGGACVVIDPGLSRQDTTTTLIGFDFLADGAADMPCVVVKNGKLALQKSKILLRTARIAVDVAATASLEFSGDNLEEHGVFAGASYGAPAIDGAAALDSLRIGVRAGESRDVKISGVRLEGLDVAVDSRARLTRLENADVVANGVGVDIADVSLRAAYAPDLEIVGGNYAENDVAAVRLSRRSFDGAGATGVGPQAFRGAVAISGGARGPALFAANATGVLFDTAYPRAFIGPDAARQPGLAVERAKFFGHTASAISLTLPVYGAAARLRDVEFAENQTAVDVRNTTDGSLTIDGPSSMRGAGAGVVLTLGETGEFAASLSAVGRLNPAFDIKRGPGGKLLVAVEDPKTPPTFMRLSASSPLCRINLNGSKVEREDFRRAFKDFNVLVGRRHICRLFDAESPEKMSTDEMKDAQRTLCRGKS
jgi:hypothetical protein